MAVKNMTNSSSIVDHCSKKRLLPKQGESVQGRVGEMKGGVFFEERQKEGFSSPLSGGGSV